MTLLHPWLLLLPLGFLPVYLNRRKTIGDEPIYYPSTELLSAIPPSMRQRLRTPVLATLAALLLALLSLAAARPHTVLTLPSTVEGRNLMLALDVSRSMRL